MTQRLLSDIWARYTFKESDEEICQTWRDESERDGGFKKANVVYSCRVTNTLLLSITIPTDRTVSKITSRLLYVLQKWGY